MKKILLLSITFLILLISVSVSLNVNDILKLQKGYVETVIHKDSTVSYVFVDKKPKNWITLDKIPKTAYLAIVISEDWAFFEHDGLDYDQLQIAVIESLQGKKLRGASTITQQLSKNLFTSSDRSLLRKMKELIMTKIIEHYIPKRKILESYLNIIEYGKNLYGIEPASKFYFGKSARYLNPKEASFLAMLLPSPVRYAQSFYSGELTVFASEVVNKILKKLVIARVLSEEYAQELIDTPLEFRNID